MRHTSRGNSRSLHLKSVHFDWSNAKKLLRVAQPPVPTVGYSDTALLNRGRAKWTLL